MQCVGTTRFEAHCERLICKENSMTKNEALKIAIEALDTLMIEKGSIYQQAINACKEALEQPAQEPVAWIKQWENMFGKHKDIVFIKTDEYSPLYTHPHQWQGLTDDEIDSAWSGVTKYGISGVDFTVRFARAIEQALKDKNT